MSKYTFGVVDQESVMTFWDDSPNGTAFTNPVILGVLSKKVDWWLVRKGEKPICMWPVCKPDGVSVGLPEFTYYVGPMWCSEFKTVPWHRWLAETRVVYEGLIRRLISQYGQIHASLSLDQHDIRVFDWWNYNDRKKPRFSIRPRYTACIKDLQSKTDDDIRRALRRTRRKEVKRNERKALQRCDILKPEEVIKLYVDTIHRTQEMTVSADTIESIRGLLNLVQAGFGEVVAYGDPGTGEIFCALLMIYAKGTANAILCAGSNTWQGTGIIAWTIYNSIRTARNQGMTTFDFNGANSPNRGDDKHSYGASPELFFDLHYDQVEKP